MPCAFSHKTAAGMITIALLLLFFIAVLGFAVNFWWRHRRYYGLLRKIPNPKGHLPIVGVAYKFIGADNVKIYDIIQEIMKPCGVSPRGAWLGPFVFILSVDDVEQVQQVLTSKDCLDRPPFCKQTLMDHGLMFASGKLWKRHRKMIDPAFNMNILRSFIPIYNDTAKLFVVKLNENISGKEFDIYDVFSPIAIQSILLTTGIMKQPDADISSEYLKHTRILELLGPKKATKFWYHWPPLLRYTEMYNIQQRSLYNGIVRISELRLREREQQYLDGMHDEQKSDERKPQIFVDQLYKQRKQFTYDDIIEEVNTMVMGGFETTTNTTSMVILLTAFFPEVQKKIVDELQRVFTLADEEVTESHINQLVYLDMVIKETLRFWPAIPVTMRCLTNDMQIGDYLVPRGTTVFVPIMHVHRDKKNFGEDADEFRPERFAPENLHKMNPNGFIPFTRTPRNCIGHRYAGMLMKTVLSYFYRNFQVATSMKLENVKFEYIVACKSSQGYKVTLTRRNFRNKPFSVKSVLFSPD